MSCFLFLSHLYVGNAVPSVPSENLTSMGKFSAFVLPLRGRIAEDSDPYNSIKKIAHHARLALAVLSLTQILNTLVLGRGPSEK